MKKLKEVLKTIIDLKLLNYKLETVKDNLLYFINEELKIIGNEKNQDFEKLKKTFDDLYKLLHKLNDQKRKNNNIPNYKIVSNRILSNKNKVLFILLIIIFIIYFIDVDIVFLTFVLVILIIIYIGLLIFSNDDKFQENELCCNYEKKLLEIIDNEKILMNLYKEINLNNNLKNDYMQYKDLESEIPIFDDKYDHLKTKINALITMINKEIKIINNNILMMYIINDIPMKYQNFLADSIFYEYIENSKTKSLNEIFNLFDKEYGIMIGDQNELLNKLADNKKEQYIDNSKINEINDIINELKVVMLSNKVLNEELNLIDNLCKNIKKQIEFGDDINKKIEIDNKLNVIAINKLVSEKNTMKIRRISNKLIAIHDDSLNYIYILRKSRNKVLKIDNDTKENIEFINKLLIEIDKIPSENFIQFKYNKTKQVYNLKNGNEKYIIDLEYILEITSVLGNVSYYFDNNKKLVYFINKNLELVILRI